MASDNKEHQMTSMGYCQLQNASIDISRAIDACREGSKHWTPEERRAAQRIIEMAEELGEHLEESFEEMRT